MIRYDIPFFSIYIYVQYEQFSNLLWIDSTGKLVRDSATPQNFSIEPATTMSNPYGFVRTQGLFTGWFINMFPIKLSFLGIYMNIIYPILRIKVH